MSKDQELLDPVQQALDRDRRTRQHRDEVASPETRYRTLTPHVCEVMGLVISGMLRKQIASELGTTEITAKVHRGQVMHKTQSSSVAELVRMLTAFGALNMENLTGPNPRKRSRVSRPRDEMLSIPAIASLAFSLARRLETSLPMRAPPPVTIATFPLQSRETHSCGNRGANTSSASIGAWSQLTGTA